MRPLQNMVSGATLLPRPWLGLTLAFTLVIVGGTPPAAPGPVTPKRIAFLIDSWYPWSHADVIGRRFQEGYRIGEKGYASPLSVASVFADNPHPTRDQTHTMATRYGFRVATSIADALLEHPQGARPRLGVDGVLIATREDLPGTRQPQSPVRRLQVMREVLRIMDQTGTRTPIFLDKMLAGSWEDSQAIVAEAARRGIPLMAGSVLAFVSLDRPLRTQGIEVAVVMASTPYWAFGFHAAELLQALVEQRTRRETGIAEVRDVGPAYLSMPDRHRWGGRVFDDLWAAARTRRPRAPAAPDGLRPQTHVLLVRYVDGTHAVLALIPDVIDDSEFLIGAQYTDGSMGTSGLVLGGEPYDHFGYLVHALVDFFATGRSPAPVERTLLTTGLTIFGQQARMAGAPMSSPTLAVSYAVTRTRP